jgi:sugar/nucleoside kinase (ribokinase family)
VTSVGCVGDDAAGRLVVELLAGHGVDVSHVAVVAGPPTAATILPIRSNGERPALHVGGRRHDGAGSRRPGLDGRRRRAPPWRS